MGGLFAKPLTIADVETLYLRIPEPQWITAGTAFEKISTDGAAESAVLCWLAAGKPDRAWLICGKQFFDNSEPVIRLVTAVANGKAEEIAGACAAYVQHRPRDAWVRWKRRALQSLNQQPL